MSHTLHFPILGELNLNQSEALIYELLLEIGPQTGQKLVTKTGLGRGNVYNVLKSLVEKGLVLEEKSNITLYKASNPEKLRELATSKVNQAKNLQNQLESILPSLKSQFNVITKRPTIRIFEGVEGLKDLYLETLKQTEPIYALVGPDDPDPELYKWLTGTYGKKRAKAGIWAHVVASGEKKAEEYVSKNKEELRNAILLDDSDFPMSGEVDVFGNTVAFMSYRSDELIGALIESPALATSLRSAIKALLFAHDAIELTEEDLGTTF